MEDDKQEIEKPTGTGNPSASRSNTAEGGNVLTNEFNHGMWQLQVLRDENLSHSAKLILLGWSLFAEIDENLSNDHEMDVYVIEPIHSEIFGENGLSATTYYRHLEKVESSEHVEVVGSFTYKAGNRRVRGVRYRLVQHNQSLGKTESKYQSGL